MLPFKWNFDIFFVFTYVKFINTKSPCTLNTLTSLIKLQHKTTAYCPLFSGLLYSSLKHLQSQNRYQRHHHAIIQYNHDVINYYSPPCTDFLYGRGLCLCG